MVYNYLHCVVILHVLICIFGEKVLDVYNDDFDFDGLPGVNYEFKIGVNAGYEECFYQKVKSGARLHVSYQVLRGAEKSVDVLLVDPFHEIIEAKRGQSEGLIDKEVTLEGVYAICIDNIAGRYGHVLVYIYMGTYVVEDWDKYLKEIEGISSTVRNFTSAVTAVQNSIEAVNQYQTHTRMHLVKDWYLVIGNNNYVLWWSISQMCIVVLTAAAQVYSLRRLFRFSIGTSTSKPRA